MSIIAIFVAIFLDPIKAFIGGIGGWFARSWVHVALAALAAAIVAEAILQSVQLTRHFNIMIFIIQYLASFFWATAAYIIKQKRPPLKADD